MAVAFGSIAIQSTLTSDGTDVITVDKPADTASGDLLIAILAQSKNTAGAISSAFALAGWTAVTTQAHNDGGTDSGYLTILAKVAGGSEPSNYTFDSSFNASALGAIIRVTGASFSGGANVQFTTDTETTDATPTYTPGITPLVANQLFIMGVLGMGDATIPASGYSIATSDPTWTEQMDVDDGGSFDAVLAIATASRAAATATGDYSLVLSGTPTCSIGFLLGVYENQNATATPTVTTITLSAPAPTVSAGASASPSVTTITLSAPAPTVTTPAAEWLNPDKSADPDWVNPTKT